MIIESTANSTVKKLTKLQKKKYRINEKKYIIASKNAIVEAQKINAIERFISTNINEKRNETMYVSEIVMEKITGIKPAPSEAAIVNIIENKFDDKPKVLVLDQLQDPGNVGTILRTARALGITNVFIGENTVDIYNPKVVRAMQGIQFHINFQHGNVIEYLKNSSLPIITTYLDEKNQIATSQAKYNLVLGNEGNGVDPQIKKLNHQNCKIEIEFESLNVAMASAIVLYKLN